MVEGPYTLLNPAELRLFPSELPFTGVYLRHLENVPAAIESLGKEISSTTDRTRTSQAFSREVQREIRLSQAHSFAATFNTLRHEFARFLHALGEGAAILRDAGRLANTGGVNAENARRRVLERQPGHDSRIAETLRRLRARGELKD